jgi:hypothetical protein
MGSVTVFSLPNDQITTSDLEINQQMFELNNLPVPAVAVITQDKK